MWGYDIFAKTFISPTKGHDMMGYCPNEWVSDYTYTALFDRIAALNGNPLSGATGQTAAGSNDFANVANVSTLARPSKWRAPAARSAWRTSPRTARSRGPTTSSSTSEPTAGKSLVATFAGVDGTTVGEHTAHFYPYDHLPGGVLVVPVGAEALGRQRLRLEGAARGVLVHGARRRSRESAHALSNSERHRQARSPEHAVHGERAERASA